ncbi:EH signature domain-containing protein [Psychrobacter sp. AOP42-A1-21]|uniref:EH signature domain-containing protein n=1 Tax=Psychrobacter sp. AOP42-A1-21 TaxID=3457675 RepID=UPI003FDA0871
MSIAYLKQRLNVSVERFSEPAQVQNKFARPQKLIKTLDIIERRFDDLENAQPIEEKIINSIKKLEKSGIDYLTKRDWKNLAWSLSKKLPHYEDKILFTFVGGKLVKQFNNMQPELLKAVYFPLLYSYFAVEQEEINKRPNNWLDLKNILSTNRSSLFQTTTRPKKWLTTLTDHPELLSADPSKKFIRNFLHNSDEERVSSQLESLSIAPNSWFWDSLVSSSIKSVKTMREDDYLEAIPRFLRLLEQNPIYTKDILTALLERYATTSRRTIVHEVLKSICLTQWGNPQYDSSAGWRNVSLDTKKMVIQWFVRADLEAFFTVFGSSADVRRFNYWMRFLKQVTLSEIFLNDQAMRYPTAQQAEFKRNNAGRFKRIVGKSNAANAFMIKIGGFYIVEFSEMNNATYFYRKLPYPPFQGKTGKVEITSLKSTSQAQFYLSHQGAWEKSFDRRLQELGIFPD